MNKIKILACVLGLSAAFTACKQEGGFDKTESGLLYKFIIENKDKPKAQIGELLTMDVIYKTENDSELMNSAKMDRPVRILLREPAYKGSLDEGFAMMSLGDSAIFKVSADSFFTKFIGSEIPKSIKKGSLLSFYIKMKEIKSKAEVEKEQQKAMAEQQKFLEEMKKQEGVLLEKYIADNKINAKPTASGLYYIETVKGKGKQAAKGKTVKVNYTGTLLTGQMFDTSSEADAKKGNIFQEGRPYEPIEFALGAGQVIAGWDEAIAMMKEGGKATLILPSPIAYGEQGAGPIQPYTSLKFEVELVEVK